MMKFKRVSVKKKDIKKLPPFNEQILRETFAQCSDVSFTTLKFHEQNVTLVYCYELVNNEMLNEVIPYRLEKYFQNYSNERTNPLNQTFHFPSLSMIESIEKAETEIFSGKLLLIFKSTESIYSLDISNTPQRKPEGSSLEVSVMGPRDNFIEDISINHALIRKRLRTSSLISDSFEIGRRTKTKLSLLYIKDIIDPNIVLQIQTKLKAINIDGLLSGTQLGELINDHPFSIFPRHTNTGRPDFAVQALLSGRFVILIDGVAYALIAPVNLFFLLKTAEDNETSFLYNSFERLIRVFAISVAVLLPAFWVALTTFHQNQIPFSLLATVIESRKGVPLPTSMEALLMLLLFEVFREAGYRLPLAVGQTLSVIGGLIIGDAAIRAGLTSPAMLVIIAGSTIATFTLVNQTLIGFVSLVRFLIIIIVSIFGFFGFFMSIFVLGTCIARVNSFGTPYLHIALKLNLANVIKTFLKMPEQLDTERPSSVHPKDTTKQGGHHE